MKFRRLESAVKFDYYYPEKSGLWQVAEVDYSAGEYEFDLRVVWRDEEGRLWTARDAGCSCPNPFEYCEQLDRLTAIDGLLTEYRAEIADGNKFPRVADWTRFIERVRAALGDSPV